MTDDELKKWDTRQVAATLTDGRLLEGTFRVTPEPGLYHVYPAGKAGGVVQFNYSGQLDDLHAGDFASIRPL